MRQIRNLKGIQVLVVIAMVLSLGLVGFASSENIINKVPSVFVGQVFDSSEAPQLLIIEEELNGFEGNQVFMLKLEGAEWINDADTQLCSFLQEQINENVSFDIDCESVSSSTLKVSVTQFINTSNEKARLCLPLFVELTNKGYGVVHVEALDSALTNGSYVFANIMEEVSLGDQVVERVNYIMSNLRKTEYSTSNYVTDVEAGYLKLDCSKFVELVIKDMMPEHYEVLPKNGQSGEKALAKDYFNYFKNMGDLSQRNYEWKKIDHIKDALPGDIIAYVFDPSEGKEASGHVMIVYSVPKKSIYKDQYYVKVVDSSKTGHYADTRKGNGAYADEYVYEAVDMSGIGIGTMYFDTGSDPYYRWKYYKGIEHHREILIARPIAVE